MHEPYEPGNRDVTLTDAGDTSGLFPDDPTPQKRENPYLRQNRVKQKPARAPKPPRKPKKGKDAPVDTTQDDPALPVRHRTSNFFFEHVKLITAILTIAVIIALVLITDVVGIVEKLMTEREQEGRATITLAQVQSLADRAEPITWGDLAPFRRRETDAKDSITWSLDVKDTPYRIMISGISTEKPPVYVRLYDMKSGQHVKLDRENLLDFIETHPPA